MAIDEMTLASAKKLRPDAVSKVLQSQAIGVYRLAYALCGRWDVGRGVARFVLNRSVKMMPGWNPSSDPTSWYQRFTIQTSRRAARHQPEPGKDVLVEQALEGDAQYVAFVSALRHLDSQPREAFVLRHCEMLNARYCALAMDCSTEAAENHLRFAEQSVQQIAGPAYDMLVKKLADAYAHLSPDEQQLVPTINGVVLKRVRLRKLIRRLVLLAEIVILAAIAWGGWELYHFVRG